MFAMIKLFFSYSHRDEDLRDELETHLSSLKRQGVIDAWHDRRILSGKDFGSEISQHLEGSQIILLLVSPYFIASDYCYDVEMTRALELHGSGNARVVPIILHPCDWQSLPFGKLKALPKDGKPISKYPNLHDAFLEITLAISGVAREFENSTSEPESPTTQSRHVDRPSAIPNIRSSNLRVKKTFTQRDKDKFERDAYEYIEKYFENSLAELQTRNLSIETEFRRIDANQFMARAYVNGEEASSCVIKFQGRGGLMGGITFAYGSSIGGGMNESLSVEDDGYALNLKPLGMNIRADRNAQLTLEGAAEAFWEMFMGNLQR